MKTLVIGDLHGQVEIVSKALDTGLPLIFLGDYLDSYTREVVDQIDTLMLVIEAVKTGRAQALLGNHEMSYLDRRMRCSGYRLATQLHVDNIHDVMLKHLNIYIRDDEFLFTHAGVSQRLLTARSQTLKEYLDGNEYFQVGRARGGSIGAVGGLYWCDWREFEPVPGIKQIVGHSRGNTIRQKGDNWCIDVNENGPPMGLVIGDGVPYTMNL